MKRSELESIFFKRLLLRSRVIITVCIGLAFMLCGFLVAFVSWFTGTWIPNAIVGQRAADGTIWWLVYPGNLTLLDINSAFLLILCTIVIMIGAVIVTLPIAVTSLAAKKELLTKECEDYHEYLASKDLEQDFNKYLVEHKLAYDEELEEWRTTFPGLKIPFLRKIKLP